MQYVTLRRIKSVSAWRVLRHALTITVLLLCITFIALIMPTVQRQLDRWGLLPRHQQMTELSVSNPNERPKTYIPNQQQTIAFTIHNLEQTTVAYDYVISVSNSELSSILNLSEGEVSLRQDQSRDVKVSFPLDDLGERIYIRVQLSNGQTIGYWLDRE